MASTSLSPARRRRPLAVPLLTAVLAALYPLPPAASAAGTARSPASHPPQQHHGPLADLRGGSSPRRKKKRPSSLRNDPYALLSSALLERISSAAADNAGADAKGGPPSSTGTIRADPSEIRSALRSLSSAQSALKGIDGTAHELYQRTHRSASSSLKGSDGGGGGGGVEGRAARSAARVGCVADGLFAAELCELAEVPMPRSATGEGLATPPSEEEKVRGNDDDAVEEDDAGTGTMDLAGREVWLNVTVGGPGDDPEAIDGVDLTLSILVLYEPNYCGRAGLNHGGIDGVLSLDRPTTAPPRGRLLVILRDGHGSDLPSTVGVLDASPTAVPLRAGLVASEVASVAGPVWRAAGRVLEAVRPALIRVGNGTTTTASTAASASDGDGAEKEGGGGQCDTLGMLGRRDPPAVHFVGRSIAGGVAALSASVLDGSLPMPGESGNRYRKRKRGRGHRKSKGGRRKQRRNGKEEHGTESDNGHDSEKHDADKKEGKKEEVEEDKAPPPPLSLSGYGRGRSSAVALGAPPCLSANVKAAFVTSVIHGDDVVCRTTRESLDRLCRRTKRAMKGGILGAKVGWMSNAVSLTVSGLKSHAHGSEGEEARLSVPGKVYLIRPRRYGGTSSMHEVGAISGREALRAAVLWQLNDVLLSRSLWAHHSLDAYIKGLDRVQLRGFENDEEDDEEVYS